MTRDASRNYTVDGRGGTGQFLGVERLRAHVRVRGRVQGVWFRESTRRRADELGLSGWVRNRADGSVEACFEGKSDAVRAALEFVREGPPLARVTACEIETEGSNSKASAATPFEIR